MRVVAGSLVSSLSTTALSLAALALVACSGGHSGTTGTGDPGAGGGPDLHNTDPAFVVQRGIILDFDSAKPVAGATVIAGDQTATTDATGAYALKVHKSQPFLMNVTAPSYVKLVEQETVLDADYDRGKTTIVPEELATLLHNTLQGYDPSLGVLSVAIIPTGACASEGHTKISVTGDDSAKSKVRYMIAKMPSNTAEDVQPGEFPSAVIYNLPVGVPITVTLDSKSCKQAAFPFAHDGMTYDATITVEAGDVTSFQRLFLQ
jgi:hypothetical protein